MNKGFQLKCKDCNGTDVYMSADGDLSGASISLICNNEDCSQRLDLDMSDKYVVTSDGDIKGV